MKLNFVFFLKNPEHSSCEFILHDKSQEFRWHVYHLSIIGSGRQHLMKIPRNTKWFLN